ncbi:MAG: glycosyltransferase family 2 protein [Bacilli bacterium]|nr:glycosyltransferase family 2 protein [Bacilli bacterium]
MMEKLYIVIPCYNEEEVLDKTKTELKKKMNTLIQNKKIDKQSKVIFVNDGSKDKTWDLIQQFYQGDKLFGGINLSRNKGHQNALLAGLLTVKDDADIVISMDADLQDDIDAIDLMIEKRKEGADVVYGVRNSRKKDSFFKRITAQGFYRVMKMLGVDVIYNHADYRLTSRRVLDSLKDYREVNLFLRGIFPLIGFKSDIVYYERKERFAGKSKYPLKKMLNFAWDGITSFSVKPIRLVLNVGVVILFLSFLMILYSVIQKVLGNTVDGWTFIVCSLWLLGGIQMLSLGIIGEYIGKIYSETKARPRYLVTDYLVSKN